MNGPAPRHRRYQLQCSISVNGGQTLDRINDSLADARQHERVLASDLAEVREHLEQLIEERWIALDEAADAKATVKWTPLETPALEAPAPGMFDARTAAMIWLMTTLVALSWLGIGALGIWLVF